LAGGPGTINTLWGTLAARNPLKLPYVMRIGYDLFKHRDEFSGIDNEQRETFIHEGIHAIPGAIHWRGMTNFNSAHQDSFDAASRYFDDE
jgi:hypothetical protein